MTSVPYPHQALHKIDFHPVDKVYRNGRVGVTNKTKEKYCTKWISYCKPLGIDPTLEKSTTELPEKVRTVFSFLA